MEDRSVKLKKWIVKLKTYLKIENSDVISEEQEDMADDFEINVIEEEKGINKI